MKNTMAILVPREMRARSLLFRILCILLTLAGSAHGSDSMVMAAEELVREFPSTPVTVNDSNIDSALKRYSPFVLECWKDGCKPCQLIRPKIDEMAKDLSGKVVFGRMNIEQEAITKEKYQVSRSPTLLIFKDGNLIYSHVGNYPKYALEAIIQKKLELE